MAEINHKNGRAGAEKIGHLEVQALGNKIETPQWAKVANVEPIDTTGIRPPDLARSQLPDLFEPNSDLDANCQNLPEGSTAEDHRIATDMALFNKILNDSERHTFWDVLMRYGAHTDNNEPVTYLQGNFNGLDVAVVRHFISRQSDVSFEKERVYIGGPAGGHAPAEVPTDAGAQLREAQPLDFLRLNYKSADSSWLQHLSEYEKLFETAQSKPSLDGAERVLTSLQKYFKKEVATLGTVRRLLGARENGKIREQFDRIKKDLHKKLFIYSRESQRELLQRVEYKPASEDSSTVYLDRLKRFLKNYSRSEIVEIALSTFKSGSPKDLRVAKSGGGC